MLKLFPNISSVLEDLCVVKTSVTAELAATILKYLSSASW